MIKAIKGQIQKLMGLQETYPSFTKELSQYAVEINKDTRQIESEEIDIIMPSFNRLSVTKRCIDYLFKTTKIKFKLIIVDNNSDEETKKYLKSIKKGNVKVIFMQENLGGGGSRMVGLKYSSSELVAFVDNDIFPMPFYFENLLKTLKNNPEISGVQSKVVFPNKLIQINRPYYEIKDEWITFYDKDIDRQYNDNSTEVSEEINWMPSGATLWRRSVFEKESFNSEFNTSFEDNEFSYRIGKKGYKFMNNHSAVCLHLSSQFTPSSVSQIYTKARFGNEVMMNSLKLFKKKYGFYISFGDKESSAKHLGYKSSDDLASAILQE